MKELSELYPAVAITLLIVVGAIVCTFIWQMWKTVRDD